MTHARATTPALPPDILALLKQCRTCKATCCTYISLPLDKPGRDEDEWESIRWYLTRPDVEVYVDDEGDWYLQLNQRCRFLQEDFSCANYENRPKVCADHDPKGCEYWGAPEFEHHWRSLEEFDVHYATVKAGWAKAAAKRRRDAQKAARARRAKAKA